MAQPHRVWETPSVWLEVSTPTGMPAKNSRNRFVESVGILRAPWEILGGNRSFGRPYLLLHGIQLVQSGVYQLVRELVPFACTLIGPFTIKLNSRIVGESEGVSWQV